VFLTNDARERLADVSCGRREEKFAHA